MTHKTAEEHVRDQMTETLRRYEQELGIPPSAVAAHVPSPPPLTFWQQHRAWLRHGWSAPIYTQGDLIYVLVIGAALGVIIGTLVAEEWL